MPFGLRAARSLLLALVVVLTGCATSGVNRGDVNIVSMEEEWQLGQQLERDLERELDLSRDRVVTSYVSQLGQRLVAQTEMSDRRWEFHVVRDGNINAFNIPGGHVYVHTGLIAAADNAAELAGAMAHEIAHGVSRHATERLTKQYGLSTGASILLGGNPAWYEQLLAQIAATGAVAKFSRDDEREADRLGVRYMAQSGYDPQGMVHMFRELLRQRERQPGAVSQFFSTHPLTEERIQNVEQQIQQMDLPRGLQMRDGEFETVRRRVR